MLVAAALPGFLDRLPADAVDAVINVGSNIDPTRAEHSAARPSVTIAFEPIVSHLIKPRPGLFIVPAAVSSQDGLNMMAVTGRSSTWVGSTSSLAPFAQNRTNLLHQAINTRGVAKAGGPMKIVPTMAMRTVLDALPATLALAFLKTDMQGYDLDALSSAGRALLRAEFVRAEVNYGGFSAYAGVNNSLCVLLDHMHGIGFELIGVLNRHVRIEPPKARHHCRRSAGAARDANFPRWSDGTMEADAFFASPARTRARPPVGRKDWPW